MNLEEKLKKQQYKEIWQQYCGFLDLSMNGYMKIQRRLMEEQVKLWSNCGLGQSSRICFREIRSSGSRQPGKVESTRSRWHRILEACWTPIGIMLQHV